MAFQQPQQRPQPLRQISPNKPVTDTPVPASPAWKRTIEDSQEWILFSPPQDSQQSSTSQTPRTATQLSEFGSLETHIRSQPPDERSPEVITPAEAADVEDDNADLDSLDDGLHAFQHHPFSAPSNNLDVSGGTVLPRHDGFGTFPSSSGLQQQLWQFERYNPQRKKHMQRRSSVQIQLDELEEEQEVDIEDDRTARIEKWRLEQSRAVLDEIEKETRRRRRRMSRMSGASPSADLRTGRDSPAARLMQRQASTIPEEQELASTSSVEQPQQQPESFWRRITRRVIRDLIGLDESTLAVIFGESLIEDPSATPKQPSPIAAAAAQPRHSRVTFNDSGYSWEVKLLEHIARELGVLVHQLTEHDGRAFHTYLRTQDEPEYAGMPITNALPRQQQSSSRQPRGLSNSLAQPFAIDSMFPPTLSQPPLSPSDAVDTSLWGIEEEPEDPAAAQLQQDREYWERDIDVAMIFTYLKQRFSLQRSGPSPQPLSSGPLPASWATVTNTASALGTSPESLRRAEVIRRQHPLVSRATERAAAQNRRRDSLLRRHQMMTTAQKRPGSSSCASQSTKRSRHSKSGSSRHYWDLGGSIDSMGSGPASAVGGWGEV